MELELTTINLNCYDMVLDTTLLDEETLESIVPDAYPDIMRILDTEAMVCLNEKKATEGRAEVSGSVRADILYLPEADGCVQRMTVSLPFSCSADLPAITANSHITALLNIRTVDTRSLNPRKVLTRVCVSVQLQVYVPRASDICSDVCSEDQADIQQLCETQDAYMVMSVEEKPFTFSDELALPGSRARIQTLLKTRVDFACSESKIIGSKLIFKGDATLYLLYLDAAGSISSAEFELPFSQIMEIVGVGEDANATLQISMTDCNCLPAGEGDDEGRTISVSLSMLAQAVVREERQVQLLTDVYSTACAVTAESKVYTFSHLADSGSRRVMMRETLETAQPVREVCDVCVRTGQVSQSKGDGGTIELSGETFVSVLYLGEDGMLYAETRSLAASCTLELPDDCVLSCQCVCPGERFASPAGGGIEVRYPILFSYLALISQRAMGVNHVVRDEKSPRNIAGQPSIILRMVTENEKLWDIAKAYGTTASDIMRANALTEEAVPVGHLLLIPKKR